MSEPVFNALLRELAASSVRYVVIGVWGANLHAISASVVFHTEDRDLFLPPDPANLLAAWQACERVGLELTCSGETLDIPRDLWLAQQVVSRRALTRAVVESGLIVDLSLVMGGFEFEPVWRERREVVVAATRVPVARLLHIVTSKALAGRPKDHLFLATHAEALRELLPNDEGPADAT
jgi:hypothetical protein